MADDLICGVTGASGDFTRAEDNFNELKRLFSRKKKRLRKPRKAKPVRTIKDISTVEGIIARLPKTTRRLSNTSKTLSLGCTRLGEYMTNSWAR
ncbi:unnamed protein product [Allacma fusca]|uniref:Uncharacterized protein n=1 Tax=Allacma fusca TaxID=39272 RepID=A0A8J2KP35_9HEXA|nr:unnamed protein product [Allacma fusca]